MIKNIKIQLAALTAAFALTGCASILSDSQYPVVVASTPTDVTFEVMNQSGTIVHSGKTPQTVQLAAGDGFFSGAQYSIRFNQPGFESKTIPLDSSIDGWYFGNILFGGLIGILIVDPATGAMFKLPERIETQLTKHNDSSEESLTVMTVDQVPAPIRHHLTAL